MYAQFFGLTQDPFSIAPDPRYLFMSERHREALAHLLYGLSGGGGFVLVTGEIGTGKTTVCRCFLEQVPANCNVAYIFNPKLSATELLRSVCDELHIAVRHEGPGQASVKDCIDPLNDYLLAAHAAGRNTVLIIDEAQNLSADVLEQLRLLTNLETNEKKLLQIVLIGQPELRTMLARPELEQLAQRVIARFHLDALSAPETEQYIQHRMAVGGMTRALPFDAKALQRIQQLSRGVPRRINLLCGRALLGAYAHGAATVTREIVDKAAAEVFDSGADRAAGRSSASAARPGGRLGRPALLGLGVIGGAAAAGAVVLAMNAGQPGPLSANVAARSVALSPATSAPAPRGVASAAAPALSAASSPASPPASPPAPALSPTELATRIAAAHRSENDAWRELAGGWSLALTEGDPCQAAARQQVQCFRSKGTGLSLIRQLGRPGILTLYDNNQPVYALVTGLSDQHATLVIGGRAQAVPLAALAGVWRGDFATFWRAPAGYVSSTVALAAPVTEWVSTRLQSLPAVASAAGNEAPLRSRVYVFQIAQGLTPDGVAGPMTFMQLNRATGVDEPRLTAAVAN